jgi:hypothetical protein
MSDEILEVPIRQAILPYYDYHSEQFRYDTKRFPRVDVEHRANEALALARKVRDWVKQTNGLVYFKITAGQKAGTIGIIHLSTQNTIIRTTRDHTNDLEVADGKVFLQEESERWHGPGAGHFSIIGAIGANYHSKYEFVVDGRGVIQKFELDDSFVDTAKPVMLIGYTGPTTWCFKRTAVEKGKETTIKDRYGREVGKGSIVIVSARPSGTQMVGKVMNITPKRSIKLRHIGAEHDSVLVGVRDDQVILLDDELQRVLMFKKLQTL